MKYENVDKAVSLKNAIDVTDTVINYFKKIRDNEREVLHLYGNDPIATNIGYETVYGLLKNDICDLIIKDYEEKMEEYQRSLERLD